MKISAKGRYSLKIMLDISKYQKKDSYISLKEISNRTDISEKYLENIVKILVKNKLLIGVRGKGGGYKLTKAPNEYNIYDILKCTEENLKPFSNELFPIKNNIDKNICNMFSNLDEHIIKYLSSINLNDLLLEDDAYIYII